VKRHVPEPAALAAALAGRVDSFQKELDALSGLRADVTSLGHGVAELTHQVRQLTATGTARQTTPASSSATLPIAPAAGGVGDEAQRDWLTVADAVAAEIWLTDAIEWATRILRPIGRVPGCPCWPLHPAAVVELLALQAQWEAAYAAAEPTAVSEWLSRWLPGAAARISAELTACAEDRGHRHRGHTYDATHLDLSTVAAWWTDTHGVDPDAVTAFALTRLQ
jgi:hypothetical protein